MFLRRLGNKKKIASEIIKHFPDHKIYIEPFFGAGGMFFNKPKANTILLMIWIVTFLISFRSL